jgi:CRP-like cAMP-binding protein
MDYNFNMKVNATIFIIKGGVNMVNKELFDKIIHSYDSFQGISIELYRSKIEAIFRENQRKMLFLKGENIIEEKECGNNIYFIERGKVILTRKDVQGREFCNGYLLPGEFFGFSACIGMPEAFNYRALTNCNIYSLDITAIKDKLMDEYKINKGFDGLIINIMRSITIRQGNLIMGGCRSSFVNFIMEHLKDFGRIDDNGDVLITLDVNLAEIAVILNMTRETLSRIVSEMKKEGIIETKRRFIRIRDLNRFIA